MRLVLLGLVSLLATPSAWAVESTALRSHTTACQSDKEVVELSKPGQDISGDLLHKLFPSTRLLADYARGTCREYTAGAEVIIDKEMKSGDLDLMCIKTKDQEKCFWTSKQ